MDASPAAPAIPPTMLRFCVGTSDGRRSMPWRVWTGERRPTDEIYVAPRHMAGDLKFSAHSGGYAQVGPTQRLRAVSSPDDRAALSRTELDTDGVRVVLRLLFHRSELRPRSADVAEATIEMRDDEDALLLLIVVGSRSSALPPGCRVAGTVARKSPDPVLLIAGPSAPVPRLLAEALAVLEAPYETWRMPVDWQYRAHGVIEVDEDVEGPPLLAEFAVDEAPADRLPISLEAFPGEVLSFDDLPVPIREDMETCAAVWIGDGGRPRLYVNEYARCDHEHLVSDVLRLMGDFEGSGPDAGWTRLGGPASGWISAIATRAAVDRGDAGSCP